MKTADLVDSYDAELRFCELQFQSLGGRRAFSGPIATVSCFEDNALLRRQLESPGNGRVLVVDGGGSLRVALVGDVMTQLAADSGWSGLLIHGAVRDVAALQAMHFGIFALGRSPKKSRKDGAGTVDEVVRFGGVDFVPGQYIYCDEDGVLVSARDLLS